MGPSGAVEVTVQLPAGSRVEARAAAAEFRGVGRLGDVTVESAQGTVRLDETTRARLTLEAGDITVGRLTGPAALRTRQGNLHITEAVHGTVTLRTDRGDITVGAARTTSATLDAATGHGRIHNGLRNTDGPPPASPSTPPPPTATSPPAATDRSRAPLNLPREPSHDESGHRGERAAQVLRDKTVLDGIDLTVPEGTIFSLLGPNGAGKTTVVKILSTLIRADGGQVRVAGHDLVAEAQAVRAAIGVTGQFSAVDGLITGEENMLLMADLHHLSRREGGGSPPICWSGSV